MLQRLPQKQKFDETERIFSGLYRSYYGELSQYSEHLRNDPITRKDLFEIRTQDDTNRYLIRDGKCQVIGFAIIGRKGNTAPDTDTFIQEFYIRPDFRKLGYGKKAALELLEEYPGTCCYLTLKGNKVAEIFWEKVMSEAGMADVSDQFNIPNLRDDMVFHAYDKMPNWFGLIQGYMTTVHWSNEAKLFQATVAGKKELDISGPTIYECVQRVEQALKELEEDK